MFNKAHDTNQHRSESHSYDIFYSLYEAQPRPHDNATERKNCCQESILIFKIFYPLRTMKPDWKGIKIRINK